MSERTWADFLDWLGTRKGLLDSVVISGGEPTVQPSLAAALDQVAALGFGVGLHSSGACPRGLKGALSRVQWLGLDVKAPLNAYDRVTGSRGSGIPALESLQEALASGVELEVRTTFHPDILSLEELNALSKELRALKVQNWVVQMARLNGSAGVERPRGLDGLAPEYRGFEGGDENHTFKS